MALPQYEGATDYVRQLDDHVKGQADAVKFAMDRFGEEFKTWFNTTFLDALKATTTNNSGADNIGVTPFLPGADTVQKALAALLTQIQAATIGQIPDGTITDAKLSNQAGQIKNKVTALENNLSEIEGEVDSHKAENAAQDKAGHIKLPEDWIAPTLLNRWENYGGLESTAGYYKDPFGTVHIKGVIKSGTYSDGTVIFTLPEGYRPTENRLFLVNDGTSYQVCLLLIQTTGSVQLYGAAGNARLVLSNIVFRL